VRESQAYFKENFLIKPDFGDDNNDAAAILRKRKEKKMGKKVEEVDPWADHITDYIPDYIHVYEPHMDDFYLNTPTLPR